MQKRVTEKVKNSKKEQISLDIPKPFFEHVKELRQRSIHLVSFFILSSIGGYLLRDTLLNLIITPLQAPIYYTTVSGGLDLSLKISLLFGSIVTLPFFIYQLFKFLEPVLSHTTHIKILIYSVLSFILLLIGVLFAYIILLPSAIRFLSLFASSQVHSLLSSDQYLSFVIRYVLGFAFIFQIPLILLLYNSFTPLSPKILIKSLKYVVLISFILAAIITPTPDIFNQLFVALPIIVLYLLSIVAIWQINSHQSVPHLTRRK